MEEEKNKTNYLDIIVVFLFCVFLLLYITTNSRYSEYKVYEKSILTKEAINKFENDIEKGNDVTISEYMMQDSNDYSNFMNNIGYKTGQVLEKIMNNGIKKTLKIVNSLFFD